MSTSRVWKIEGGEEWLSLPEELRSAVWEEMLRAAGEWRVKEPGSYVLAAWTEIRKQAKANGGWVDREMIARVCDAMAVVAKRELGAGSAVRESKWAMRAAGVKKLAMWRALKKRPA